MAGLPYVITEACVDVKDRACVDVCPVQCIYELRESDQQLVSEMRAGDGEVVNSHPVDPAYGGYFGSSMLYINPEECTACTACLSECPVGAIYTEDTVPDGTAARPHHSTDPWPGNDELFFIELNRLVFADHG